MNLIGEHTDYNDGFVLPFALPQRVAVAASARADEVVTVATIGSDGHLRRAEPMLVPRLRPGSVTGWAGYVAGVVWVLREAGPVRGADLLLCADLPTGAGLSSSAAVECAVLLALLGVHADGAGRPLAGAGRRELASFAQRAENDYVGVPCGALDQTASLCCVAGHALFLDLRSGDIEQIPFELVSTGLQVLVIDTRVHHSLAASAYGERRAGCERAATLLGVTALRDVAVADVDAAARELPDELVPLLRHVVTENARVLTTVDRLRSARTEEIGPLLDASHESLRADYRVSCPELDLAVWSAREAGAIGARMTGGGFGGSAIALVRESDRDRVARAIRAAFDREGSPAPRIFDAVPSAGAGRDW